MAALGSDKETGAGIDWVVALLISAAAIRVYSNVAALIALLLLVFATFARKVEARQTMSVGPILVFIAAVGIVLARPDSKAAVIYFILFAIIVIRVVLTVDARVVIASLIDGAGIYLLINVIGHFLGLESPNAGERVGAYIESGGFVRTIFPLSTSLEVAPTIASVYIAAILFLIKDADRKKRILRLGCTCAAIYVASQAADRTGLVAAVVLPAIALVLPSATRFLGPVATVFAAFSALILPRAVEKTDFLLVPFLSFLAPDRDTHAANISSLNNRAAIWSDAMDYWRSYVTDLPDKIFGFGQDGQYRSGVSMAYADELSGTVKNSHHASLHNSFLQQLFDGGLLGWFLLAAGIYWASIRLAKRELEWGPQGVAASLALVALLINSTTQVSIAPGLFNDSFWLLLVLVAVACQLPSGRGAPDKLPSVYESSTGNANLVTRGRG